MRTATAQRSTSETNITATVVLEAHTTGAIDTGIGFFDHMLEQLAFHSGIQIDLHAKGDLHIDAHHTVEDCGYALGTALKEALGDGIVRYGHALIPMDEALARAVVDFSGRPCLVFQVSFTQGTLGQMDCELFAEFFRSLTQAAGMTLHIEVLYGHNNHHKIEAVFKAVAQALQVAVAPRGAHVPSTKGKVKHSRS